MWSSELPRRSIGVRCLFAFACGLAWVAGAGAARSQTPPAPGFALERLSPAPAGAGWFVMDDLDLEGGLDGAIALTTSYARDPLSLSAGSQHLTVVANEVVAQISAAVRYDRFRVSLDLPMPLLVSGHSGTLGGYAFTAPSVDPGSHPDSLTELRVGLDARILGEPGGRIRVGASGQLFVPSNAPSDTQGNQLTDGTVRAMFRVLLAGDLGLYRYAGQLGFHLRPLDQAPIPGGAAGSELLFGVAAGRRFEVGKQWAAVIGPEIFGETALASFLGGTTTGVEGLLTARVEGTSVGAQPRFKLGLGGGLDPQFGAPQWRAVLAVELLSNPRVERLR